VEPLAAQQADVDVMMPVRDVPTRWLSRALTSTLRSRGVSLRVVVVDHASRVPVVVDDPRVHVLRVDSSLRFAEAMAAGLSACTSPFVARMDGDDVMHPDRLRLQLRALVDDDRIGAVASRVKVLPKTTTAMRGYVAWQNAALDAGDHARELWIEQPLCHPATTFRRQALQAVGGYFHVDGPEDYDLYLRLFRGGWRLVKLPLIHHGWRQHAQQVTRTRPTHTLDKIAALKARHLVEYFRLRERVVVVAGAGKEGRRICRGLREHGVAVAGFVDVDPRKIGRLVHGAPVHPTAWLASRPPDSFVVGAVGTSGARTVVRAFFVDAGVTEGEDGVVVA
jgi:glycosyltransferase involved in cell wall biosynthesis